MIISLIAAIGKNRELGKNNQLIWHLPNDLKFFKETTSKHTIIMGRKTFESIGRPLPNRRNIVLSKTNPSIDNVEVFSSVEDALKACENENQVFIIGGEGIYSLFIDKADKIFLTEVDEASMDADAYFPYFDKEKYSKEVLYSNSDNNIKYDHVVYTKIV